MKNNIVKIICLCLVISILAACVVGCKKDKNPTISDENTADTLSKLNENQQIASEDIKAKLTAGSADLIVTGKGKPNVSEMFADATKVYTDIENGTIGFDNTAPIQQIAGEGGVYLIYHLVMDDRFHTFAELQFYLNSLFTETVIKQFCDYSSFADNEEGYLCARTGAGGTNPLYAGHTFEITEDADTEIKFTATVYNYKDYNDIPEDNTPFYSTPENPDNFNTEKINYTLAKQENGKWLFTEFKPIF